MSALRDRLVERLAEAMYDAHEVVDPSTPDPGEQVWWADIVREGLWTGTQRAQRDEAWLVLEFLLPRWAARLLHRSRS